MAIGTTNIVPDLVSKIELYDASRTYNVREMCIYATQIWVCSQTALDQTPGYFSAYWSKYGAKRIYANGSVFSNSATRPYNFGKPNGVLTGESVVIPEMAWESSGITPGRTFRIVARIGYLISTFYLQLIANGQTLTAYHTSPHPNNNDWLLSVGIEAAVSTAATTITFRSRQKDLRNNTGWVDNPGTANYILAIDEIL